MIFYLCLSIVICFIYYIILFIRFVSYRSGSLARVELKSAVVGNTIFGYLATCRLHYYPSTTTTTTQLLPFFYYHSTATVVDNSMLWEVERTILAPSLTTIIGWGWDCDNKATLLLPLHCYCSRQQHVMGGRAHDTRPFFDNNHRLGLGL